MFVKLLAGSCGGFLGSVLFLFVLCICMSPKVKVIVFCPMLAIYCGLYEWLSLCSSFTCCVMRMQCLIWQKHCVVFAGHFIWDWNHCNVKSHVTEFLKWLCVQYVTANKSDDFGYYPFSLNLSSDSNFTTVAFVLYSDIMRIIYFPVWWTKTYLILFSSNVSQSFCFCHPGVSGFKMWCLNFFFFLSATFCWTA
jgi:hypothetical protein